jgi:acid phosphatase type 7
MRIRLLTVALAAAVASACSGSPTAPSSVSTNVTAQPGNSGATEVLVGAGDIADCNTSGAAATAALLDRQPGTVFTAGDNAYQYGSEENFRDCYGPTWGRHRSRTRPALGNHEYETPGAAAYFSYFGSRAGSGDGYYAYTLGAWRIIVLNSETMVSAGSAQAAWLRNELAGSSGGCTAAYWHRPLVSSGPHGDNADMRDLFQILYDGGVDFVVTGHDHLYERFEPIDANGRPDPTRGIRQFIVGTGGATLRAPVRFRAGSEVQGTSWGIIRFDLAPGSYHWQFVPVDGQSFTDSGTEICR